jgi:hypothetical protein
MFAMLAPELFQLLSNADFNLVTFLGQLDSFGLHFSHFRISQGSFDHYVTQTLVETEIEGTKGIYHLESGL